MSPRWQVDLDLSKISEWKRVHSRGGKRELSLLDPFGNTPAPSRNLFPRRNVAKEGIVGLVPSTLQSARHVVLILVRLAAAA